MSKAIASATDRLSEAARNRLLRRADWRFLLPDWAPRRSVCYSGGLLAEAVAAISTQVIDERSAPRGDCSLAVAVNPDLVTLRRAWAALEPGGACYSEWYTPLAGGWRGIKARLQAAGFVECALYWAWPPPARRTAGFWLPLEAPGALRYFLTTRRTAGDKVGSAKAALRALWQAGQRGGVLLPVCAVARKPPLPEAAASGDLRQTLMAGWQGWGLGARPADVSLLLLTGGPRSSSKVVALGFAAGERRPRLAVKMARVPEAVPALRCEAAILQELAGRRPPGVPRLLFCREGGRSVAVGETALAGQPLYSKLGRDNYGELARKATRWLADLAGNGPALPPAAWWDRLVEPVLADFERSFAPVLAPGAVAQSRTILATLPALPMAPEQRDFSPWNVLLDRQGNLSVLDWESAEPVGLPGLDLVYFLTYLAFFLEGSLESGQLRESYRDALDPASFTGKIQQECFSDYAARTGISPAAWRPLRLLAWLLHSRSEYTHYAADAAGEPSADQLRRSTFLALWEEELQHVE